MESAGAKDTSNAKGEPGIEIGVIEKPQTIEKPQKSEAHEE